MSGGAYWMSGGTYWMSGGTYWMVVDLRPSSYLLQASSSEDSLLDQPSHHTDDGWCPEQHEIADGGTASH